MANDQIMSFDVASIFFQYFKTIEKFTKCFNTTEINGIYTYINRIFYSTGTLITVTQVF